MNEMAETNKLLKKAVKSTYKKLTSVPKQYPKKTPNNMKASTRKLRRQLNLLKTIAKITKTLIGPLQERLTMNNIKENMTSKEIL